MQYLTATATSYINGHRHLLADPLDVEVIGDNQLHHPGVHDHVEFYGEETAASS